MAGKEVKTLSEFLAATREIKPGMKLELAVLRDGKQNKLTLQLPEVGPRIGFTVRTMEGKEGLFVTGLAKDSPAIRAGLAEGDRVVSVNGQATQTVRGFERILSGLGDAASVARPIRPAATTRVVPNRPTSLMLDT